MSALNGVTSHAAAALPRQDCLYELEAMLDRWIEESLYDNRRDRIAFKNILLDIYQNGGIELDVNERNLGPLPEGVFDFFPDLEKINLQRCHLEEIPKGMRKLPHLKVVNLSYSRIKQFPELVAEDFPALEDLDLRGNNLEDLPKGLQKLPCLEKLDLGFNRIAQFPELVAEDFPRLKKLDLFESRLSTVLDGLQKLPYLEELNLSHNRIIQFPELVAGDFPMLKEFELHNCRLNTLPKGVQRLPNLKKLNISLNDIGHFPRIEAGDFPELKELRLNYCQLETFPEGVQRLPNLQKLLLDNNAIERFPEIEDEDFPALWDLDMTNCGIAELPQSWRDRMQGSRLNIRGITLNRERAEQRAAPAHAQQIVDESIPEGFQEARDSFYGLLGAQDHEDFDAFILKLEMSKDYTSSKASKKHLLSNLMAIMKEGIEDEGFRKETMEIIREDGLGTCADGAALAMNKLYAQLVLHKLPKNDEQAVVKTLVGLHRMRMIPEVLMDEKYTFIDGLGNGRIRVRFAVYSEQKETVLKLELNLKDELGLPVANQGMLFDFCAQVTEEMVGQVKKDILDVTSSVEDKVEILLQFEEWKKRLDKDPEIVDIRRKWNEALMKDPGVFKVSRKRSHNQMEEEAPSEENSAAEVIDLNAKYQTRIDRRYVALTKRAVEGKNREVKRIKV